MTTFTYPNIIPGSVEFRPVSNTAVHRDPFSDYVQTADREGERWIARIAYPFLDGDDRAVLLAFMAKLNGMQHRFTMQDFGHAQRGTRGGTPLVKGASQTGKTLEIDGATVSVTNWLRTGDRISIANKMYQIDDDANSDGSGNVTLTITPRIFTGKSPADNAAIEIATPVELFILQDGEYSVQTTRNMISTLSFIAMGVPNE